MNSIFNSGDIFHLKHNDYYTDLNPVIGSEVAKRRPVLID